VIEQIKASGAASLRAIAKALNARGDEFPFVLSDPLRKRIA
jgi:hypothetical protein